MARVGGVDVAGYFDFTCGYSYRAWMWSERLLVAGVELDIDWRPFVLKEVNRAETEPSLLAGPTIDSVAVLALGVAEALRGQPGLETYRAEIFDAMHEGDERPGRDIVVEIAARAGLDMDSFSRDETLWLGTVRASHEGAIARWGVFGTPTLVFDETDPMYLKLTELPTGSDRALWDSVVAITTAYPEVRELKRPTIST